MKIILDITRLVRRISSKKTLTGIDRVSIAYVKHFRNKSHALIRYAGKNFILSNNESLKLFTWILNPDYSLNILVTIIKGAKPQKQFREAILINTGHIGLKQKNYSRMINKLNLKPFFVVHDLIPIIYPEYCSTGEEIRHATKINYVINFAHGIITNSNATLTDLKNYAKNNNRALPKSKTSLLASDMQFLPNNARPIKNPYFVVLSTIDPRKNHILLLQIWRKFVQDLGESAPHLIIIGKRGWECEQVIDLLDRCKFLLNFVDEVSKCNDQDLVNYICHSQALLFPSFAEGYGLPLIEALSLKIPVISSDLPVFKEIAGEIPEYIDPLDGKKWAEVILEYTNSDSKLRKNQLERIANFTGPSWKNHFQIVDSFINDD